LVAEAAGKHPGVQWLVTAPIGLHPQMQQIIADRISSCLAAATSGAVSACDVCDDAQACQLRP